MKIIHAADVDQAYFEGITELMAIGEWETSQRGRVLVSPVPFTTVYTRPNYRVLFNEKRDANPFFHLVESVWMLAGERDARFLDRYVKNFSKSFGEENGEIHGAYGYRWRRHFDTDQILKCGEMLYHAPHTRRVVLTMWDPNSDLDVVKNDIPCNTQIFFRIREDIPHETEDGKTVPVLDMQVCNRSNDAIWGAYGANAVHMSVLHEVMAGLAGVQLGTYYQCSFNFHAYEPVLQKVGVPDPAAYRGEPLELVRGSTPSERRKDALNLLEGCESVIRNEGSETTGVYWLDNVVIPMMTAHKLWKDREKTVAFDTLDTVKSSDWQAAARGWFERRTK